MSSPSPFSNIVNNSLGSVFRHFPFLTGFGGGGRVWEGCYRRKRLVFRIRSTVLGKKAFVGSKAVDDCKSLTISVLSAQTSLSPTAFRCAIPSAWFQHRFLFLGRGGGAIFLPGGGKKLLLLRTLPVRHSSAGQPSVRSGKRMVPKGKKKRTVLVIAVIGGRIDMSLCELTEYDTKGLEGIRSGDFLVEKSWKYFGKKSAGLV